MFICILDKDMALEKLMVGDLDVMKLVDYFLEQICFSRYWMLKFYSKRQGLHSGKYSLKFFILSQLMVQTSS